MISSSSFSCFTFLASLSVSFFRCLSLPCLSFSTSLCFSLSCPSLYKLRLFLLHVTCSAFLSPCLLSILPRSSLYLLFDSLPFPHPSALTRVIHTQARAQTGSKKLRSSCLIMTTATVPENRCGFGLGACIAAYLGCTLAPSHSNQPTAPPSVHSMGFLLTPCSQCLHLSFFRSDPSSFPLLPPLLVTVG